MSGIYGMFRFDGAPVERKTLSIMREAMAYYGPDGGGEWHEGSVGLGHLLLRVTPEDAFEAQPISMHGVTLVTYARLDNRHELLKEFGIPAPEQPTIPDSALVLEAYRKWGEGCPDHLNGDWQFAAWNLLSRSLFVARDHHGNTGLYYYRNSRFIAFASSQKALLALPGVPRKPDLIKMAQILTAWPGEGWRSSHEDIFRLPPAHILRASENSFDVKRYWFPEYLPVLRRANDQEYEEEFLYIYREAVRSRLRSVRPIGVSLSGGLDSGSVTALAAPLLAEKGKELKAFTSVPLYEPVGAGSKFIGNEWEFASATARMSGNNVVHIPLISQNISVLEGIRRQQSLQDAPIHGASNMYWIHDLMEHCRDNQISTLLTGQCGNGTVSFRGNGQFILSILKGEFFDARDLFLYSDVTIARAIKRQIMVPLSMPIVRFYRSFIENSLQPWQNYSAINSSFARNIDLLTRMKNDGHDPTFTISPLQNHQHAILRIGSSTIGATWHEIGAGYGIDVRDPTSDRLVIEFCVRLPDVQYRRRGWGRRLVRNSMSTLMPSIVLENNRQGRQAADLYQRIKHEKNTFLEAIKHVEKSALARDCLDIPYMEQLLQETVQELNVDFYQKFDYILTRGISVGGFLTDLQ